MQPAIIFNEPPAASDLAHALADLQPGEGHVIYGLSNEAYHAGPGLSRTGVLRLLHRTPWHYHHLDTLHEVPPPEPTPAMLQGTATHARFLEPLRYQTEFVVGPDIDHRTKDWKAFVEAHKAQTILTPQQHATAVAQALALSQLPDLAALMEFEHVIEASAYWRDASTGVLCRCRPDLAALIGVGDELAWVLCDVKTTSKGAGFDEFAVTVANAEHEVQAAWYSEGWSVATGMPVASFMFAAVEVEYPHGATTSELPPDWYGYGWRKCCRALDLYADCLKRGEWPGYPHSTQVLVPPRWLERELSA